MSETSQRPLLFRKSSYSANTANCVEVAEVAATHGVAVRDSKNPGGHISFTSAEWHAFVSDLKSDKL
ncbi:DUF397 domain-containing protein [Nocardiopsis suaedae]|uniref:DUF397 domain-containing protein n=1 Tax=Nocardiopsis suaedae TaxID=3018444 RepID=A0ABT4TNB9_9ACTN|nr:DUF397 domain-containing protein [Nocardiopsis suaedae]MDA2806168.1 DUF397 domain-containing protein [Nocardiopsis suaedae]